MPKQARDFDDIWYHEERLEQMQWDDLLASYILALHWSSGEGAAGGAAVLNTRVANTGKRVRQRQLESHLDCVAVTYVKGKWYIAANRLNLTDHEIVLADYSIGKRVHPDEPPGDISNRGVLTSGYEIVQNGNYHWHAEMKILKRLKTLGLLDECNRIGVSKPCCPRCSKVLNDWKIDFTSYHAVMPQGDTWTDPGIGMPQRFG
jgi:hypothetical protein